MAEVSFRQRCGRALIERGHHCILVRFPAQVGAVQNVVLRAIEGSLQSGMGDFHNFDERCGNLEVRILGE
jgi:hypothetical protein